MRVVGGAWRGRQLATPEGRGTRPTTDRTREAVASMILSAAGLDLSGLAVLDAFAGSGAMGLELLSRGAARCTFVERDRRAAAVVRKNVTSLGAGSSAAVVVGDALSFAEAGRLAGPFGVVFLDPPYALEADAVSGLVASLARDGQLADGAIVVYERAAGSPGLEAPGLTLVKTKERGTTACDLMTYAVDARRGVARGGANQPDDPESSQGTSPLPQNPPSDQSTMQEAAMSPVCAADSPKGD